MASFLDNIVVGLNKGVSSVKEGSKMIVEKANANNQVKELEREKARILQNMGTLVYNLQVKGELSVTQCAGMCSEVAAIDKQIIDIQAQIQEMEAQKQQPASGGYAQTVVPTEPVEGGVTCACGFVNKPGAKFCAKCGTPM